MSRIYKNLIYSNHTNDLLVQFETVLALTDNPSALGVYACILLLSQLNAVNLVNEDVLMDILRLSKATFTRNKNELIERGLLEEVEVGEQKKLIVKTLPQISNFNPPNAPVALAKYLVEVREKLGQVEPIQEKVRAKKAPQFPASDYKVVLEAYQKYKGVSIKGAEANIVRRATKTMFQSERSVKNILDFMKWISQNEDKKGMEWLKSWTIWTVQKKMPEFLAGKLKTPETTKKLEDMYETIN